MKPTVHHNALHSLTQRLPIARLSLFLPRTTFFFPQVRVSSILFCHPTIRFSPSSAIQSSFFRSSCSSYSIWFPFRVLHCSQFPGIPFTCPNDRNRFSSVASNTIYSSRHPYLSNDVISKISCPRLAYGYSKKIHPIFR